MNLFKNRPLAFFCFIFIVVGAIAYRLGQQIRMLLLLLFFLCASVFVAFYIFRKRQGMRLLYGVLCCAFALFVIASQLLLIDARRERALEYEGERVVRMLVVSEERAFEQSGEYKVRIKEIDGRAVSIPSVAVTAFPSDISVGDELYARAEIYAAGEEILGFSRSSGEGVYIHVAIYSGDECARLSRNNLSVGIVAQRLRSFAAEAMDSSLGGESSVLARGFLLCDRIEISASVLRDFRRAGVSHLLAVSGLHISVIVGAIELIMRRLGIRRSVRCIALSVLVFLFLAITGFSVSASRSVVMLLSVYLCYLFVKENDSLTALFVSVAIRMLVSPHSVSDVGLWLSFLATLGILTVYRPLAEIVNKRRRGGALGFCRYIFEKLFFALLLTFVCNVFICIVVWAVFGEISVIALLSNLLLSPLVAAFIILAPITLLLCRIPVIGGLAVGGLSMLGRCITLICRSFSEVKGAVISLRYEFAGVIIVIMSLSIAVMLVIRLRRKWTVILPPLVAVAVFAASLIAYNAIHMGEVRSVYYADGKNEMIVLSERGSGAVCDISSGDYFFMKKATDIAADTMATEMSEYILTHYHERRISTLERIVADTLLRRIYLPYPETEADIGIMAEIENIAHKYRVEVSIYRYGERLQLLDGAFAAVLCDPAVDDASHGIISVVIGNGSEVLSYIGHGGKDQMLDRITESSNYIIFGAHGGVKNEKYRYAIDDNKLKAVILLMRSLSWVLIWALALQSFSFPEERKKG